MAVRVRRDAWALSVGTIEQARTEPWDPVLDTYAAGVALMRDPSRVAVDSWVFAANVHGVPPGAPSNPAWDQCEHGSPLFLPWHRAYLAWFESTIRRVTGEDDWALPYWDYSDPDRSETLDMPPEFLVSQRTVDGELVDNPLFSAGRSGNPLPSADVDLVSAMSQARFVAGRQVQGFGGVDRLSPFAGLLESRPHNFVHVDISGQMRSPTVAARDPIFWLHHSNIDRLWEVWRKLPGSLELLADPDASAALKTRWSSARYFFGSGHRYDAQDLVDTRTMPLGYVYEADQLPPPVAVAVDTARQRVRGGRRMGIEEIGPERDWAPVASQRAVSVATDGVESDLRFDRRSLLATSGSPGGLVIELDDVTALDPHGSYVVEVRANPTAPAHVAGVFSTFGLEGTPDDERRSYLVDATDSIGALLDDQWDGASLSVSVRPDTSRDSEGSGIEIGQLTVYIANE